VAEFHTPATNSSGEIHRRTEKRTERGRGREREDMEFHVADWKACSCVDRGALTRCECGVTVGGGTPYCMIRWIQIRTGGLLI
jgi:hypothetical protein